MPRETRRNTIPEPVRVDPDILAAIRDAEPGRLTGALDRAWSRLSRHTRGAIDSDMTGRRRNIRTLAAHPSLAGLVAEELKAAAEKSARFVADIGAMP